MFKCRRHAVDFAFGETMPCGFVAPLRDGLTDLCGYFAGLAKVQFEISRHLHCQRERGRVVVFVDRGAENARLDVGWRRVEVVSDIKPRILSTAINEDDNTASLARAGEAAG